MCNFEWICLQFKAIFAVPHHKSMICDVGSLPVGQTNKSFGFVALQA